MAQPLPSEMAGPIGGPRKADPAPRRKLAQRRAPVRQAAIGNGIPAEHVAVDRNAAAANPAVAGKIDPIGDLMRGLGLGRDSEG
ncbi:hypothetical protein [uncultured Methylobacterium sp.]|uniref:hypothetical protein n=1 Tax=uncultured Methylobacterium sp. TaxID=157278 RepID=UPI0035CBF8CD